MGESLRRLPQAPHRCCWSTGRLPSYRDPSDIEEAAGSTVSQTTKLADDLACYALRGNLPPGVTSLPGEASPQFTCSGGPSM
jgi:hypothetical protein